MVAESHCEHTVQAQIVQHLHEVATSLFGNSFKIHISLSFVQTFCLLIRTPLNVGQPPHPTPAPDWGPLLRLLLSWSSPSNCVFLFLLDFYCSAINPAQAPSTHKNKKLVSFYSMSQVGEEAGVGWGSDTETEKTLLIYFFHKWPDVPGFYWCPESRPRWDSYELKRRRIKDPNQILGLEPIHVLPAPHRVFFPGTLFVQTANSTVLLQASLRASSSQFKDKPSVSGGSWEWFETHYFLKKLFVFPKGFCSMAKDTDNKVIKQIFFISAVFLWALLIHNI